MAVLEHFDPAAVWTFGDRIRKARRHPLVERAGFSQQEMASELGVPVNRYSNWEAGYNEPRRIVEIAKQVAELTGYPVDWLLGLSTRWNPETPDHDGWPDTPAETSPSVALPASYASSAA